MINLGVDFYLVLLLIVFQLGILSLFTFLYYKKKQPAFLSLVFSIAIFIVSNVLILSFINRPQIASLDLFQGILAAAGLAPIVVFLEIFENGLSFTKRSSLSICFLLIVGSINGATFLFTERIGSFINLMAPIMYIAIGTFYNSTIKQIRDRIRFENQKNKIKMIRLGIYLTFIIPKFIIGAILSLTVLPILLRFLINHPFFHNYNIDFLQTPEMKHIIDVILNLFQTIGLLIISMPIIYSKSVFFMQSRKVSNLVVLNSEGLPIYEFQFEVLSNDDKILLQEAYIAINAMMSHSEVSKQKLKTINFGDLEIMLNIRTHFAILLVVDRRTVFLNNSLNDFTDSFEQIYPEDNNLNAIRIQKIKYTAEKMVQKSFGLEDEEFTQIKAIVSQGYDKLAGTTQTIRSEESPEIKLLPDFIDRLPVGARVLDAGCGAGEPITRILGEKFKVTGVDLSRKQIDIARESLPYCDFIWQDMTTLTFPDEYFDGIISYYAIPHIPREEHKGLLENFYRMLKSSGIVLFCFRSSDQPGTVVDRYFGVKMYWSSYDAETNIEMLKEVGFNVIWFKLIFDEVSDEQHIFVLAQKSQTNLLEDVKESTSAET